MKNNKFAQIIFKIFAIFFFSKNNRILTEFFFKYKKIAKISFKIVSEFICSKDFFYENFFLQIFFLVKIFFFQFFLGENFFYPIFFGENFSFHKNISATIFFTIFSRISFVFDVCEIMYFTQFFIRNFAYCDFFCFAMLVYGKKL